MNRIGRIALRLSKGAIEMMNMKRLPVLVVSFLFLSGVWADVPCLWARGGHDKASGVTRDSHGKIARSSAAKEEFMRKTGYPHGRPGYVVDHIVPLKRGGADSPSNMQWQTEAEAKLKDKTE